MSGKAEAPDQAETGLEELARRATAGDRAALDRLVRMLEGGVYNLALRMLGHPQDAEDATQEVLVKVVSGLAGFRGDSAVSTWVWRIATNHLLSARRGRREVQGLTFEAFEEMLVAGLAANLPPPAHPEQALLEEEVKLGCTQTMLTCLDREHRLAFILAEVLELTGEEAAAALDIAPAAFRKRLSRARARLRRFMKANCGLVSEKAACRCKKQIGPLMHMGAIDPTHLVHAGQKRLDRGDAALRRQFKAIEEVERSVGVFHEQPLSVPPEALQKRVRRLIAASP